MKAPDVIYVEFSEDVNLAFEEQPFEETPAYIRKEALLEWASGELMPGNSAEGKGWNLALQTLIDKLNEM